LPSRIINIVVGHTSVCPMAILLLGWAKRLKSYQFFSSKKNSGSVRIGE